MHLVYAWHDCIMSPNVAFYQNESYVLRFYNFVMYKGLYCSYGDVFL